GERRNRAPLVDLRLGAFRLEFVEDAGQFGDLPLVEVELVRQEAQRPADAEGAGAKVVTHVGTHGFGVAADAVAAAPGAEGERERTGVAGTRRVHRNAPFARGGSAPAGTSRVGDVPHATGIVTTTGRRSSRRKSA